MATIQEKIDEAVRSTLAEAFRCVGLDSYAVVASEFVGSSCWLPNHYETVPKFVNWLTIGAVRKHGSDLSLPCEMLREIALRIENACFAASEHDEDSEADVEKELNVAKQALEALRKRASKEAP
jgi:hypothetical protein